MTFSLSEIIGSNICGILIIGCYFLFEKYWFYGVRHSRKKKQNMDFFSNYAKTKSPKR